MCFESPGRNTMNDLAVLNQTAIRPEAKCRMMRDASCRAPIIARGTTEHALCEGLPR